MMIASLVQRAKKKTGTATNSFDRIDQPILAGFHFWALFLLLGD
jgi:hypothetical protein